MTKAFLTVLTHTKVNAKYYNSVFLIKWIYGFHYSFAVNEACKRNVWLKKIFANKAQK